MGTKLQIFHDSIVSQFPVETWFTGFRRAYRRGGLGRVLITGLKKVFQYGNLEVKIRLPKQAIQPQNQVAIMTLVDLVALSEDQSAIS